MFCYLIDISDDDDKNSEDSSIPPFTGDDYEGEVPSRCNSFFTTCFLLLFIIKPREKVENDNID